MSKTYKLRLPRAAAIFEALEAVGQPRSLSTVRDWTSGLTTAPAWAVAAIASYTGVSAGVLCHEFARRWHLKHPSD